MPRRTENLVYYATAPIRLFGRSRAFRFALAAVIVGGGFFAATLWALDRFLPGDNGARETLAKLPKPPPLPPVTRTSYVIAPVAVSLVAIRASLDNSAPREFSGKNDNPVSKLLSKADIGITLSRGSMTVNGAANELTVNTPITGSLQITDQLATQAGNLTISLAGLHNQTNNKQHNNNTKQEQNQNAQERSEGVV